MDSEEQSKVVGQSPDDSFWTLGSNWHLTEHSGDGQANWRAVVVDLKWEVADTQPQGAEQGEKGTLVKGRK